MRSNGRGLFASNLAFVANIDLKPLSARWTLASTSLVITSVRTQDVKVGNFLMLTTRTNRLDPSLIPEEQLTMLAKVFAKPDHVALIDEHGNRTLIPEALFTHFARIVRLMNERKAIVMLPEDELFTTQAAANYLGMSRQFFVNLLEKGEIPHHRVGTHRRVTFKDLLDYEKKRDKARREAMDRLTDEVAKAGLYFSDYKGEE